MESSFDYSRVIIMGLGDIRRMDMGFGVHVVRRLQQSPPRNVVVAEVREAIVHALDLVKQIDIVIAVGALRAGGDPGTLYWFSTNDARHEFRQSLRDLGIIEIVRQCRERPQNEIMVLGAEPENIGIGGELSPTLQNILPRTVDTLRGIAEELAQKKRHQSRQQSTLAVRRRMLG